MQSVKPPSVSRLEHLDRSILVKFSQEVKANHPISLRETQPVKFTSLRLEQLEKASSF